MLLWHLDRANAEPNGHLAHVAACPPRAEEHDLATRHERRPDKLVGAGLLVIAVDEHQAGTNAHQRIAWRFGGLRESGGKAGELDRGTEESGGERI